MNGVRRYPHAVMTMSTRGFENVHGPYESRADADAAQRRLFLTGYYIGVMVMEMTFKDTMIREPGRFKITRAYDA
jgi:hypothetical protein